MSEDFFEVEQPDLRRYNGECEVTFPVSYTYNGGIIIDGKWYKGFRVPYPKLREGFTLKTLGVGLDLNQKPPRATMLLTKAGKEDKK